MMEQVSLRDWQESKAILWLWGLQGAASGKNGGTLAAAWRHDDNLDRNQTPDG